MTEKILFIYFFQPFAQYRNSLTFYYAQSYPLPPKTTIIGMLQRITGRYYDEEFWNLKISVHGGFESRLWNLQQLIGTPRIRLKKIGTRAFICFESELQTGGTSALPLYGSKTKMIAKAYRGGITHQEELFNGHIYMFIRGKEDLLKEIYDAIQEPPIVLRLGRSEDIIFVRKILWVPDSSEVIAEERTVEDTLMLFFPTYIRLKSDNNAEIGLRKENLQRFPTYMIPIRQSFYIIPKAKKKRKRNSAIDLEKTKVNNLYELLSVDFKHRMRDVYFETVLWTGFNAILEFERRTKVLFVKIKNKNSLKFWIIDEFGWL